jgi:non-heme chloroperoxidase
MTAIAQREPAATGRMKTHAVRGGGGLRLHVREWGRVDGPPILLIHGWSQNHLCWVKQYESALADEFRLVAYDLRGHGMSEAPLEAEHYTDGRHPTARSCQAAWCWGCWELGQAVVSS